jgi:putative ABC transport system permease protein
MGGMKFAPLVWSALWRKPAETLLTWLAASAAFTLFGLMIGLHVHTRHLIEMQRMDRLFVVMRYPDQPYTGLPIALAGQLARIDGVTGVGVWHWLQGYHGDPHNSAAITVIDEGMLQGWPEGPLTPAMWEALRSQPDGIWVSRKQAEKWGLRTGDRFPITTPPGTRADGNTTWVFRVLGVVPDIADWELGFIFGNYHYVDSAAPPDKQGLGNTYFVALKDGARAPGTCREIDRRFANSGSPTFCVPRRLDAQGLVNSDVDISSVTLTIAAAGMFMILFLIANTIARSVRERTPELAVLETLGFRHVHLMMLIFAEAAIPCLLGAAVGTGVAALVTRLPLQSVSTDLVRILSTPELPFAVLAEALASALVLVVCSSIVPLLHIRRMSVTEALAGR